MRFVDKAAVSREHDDAIRVRHGRRGPLDAAVAGALELHLLDPRVAVANVAVTGDELSHHLEARGLARIVDVGLVGHPEEQEPRALDRQPDVVERVGDLLHDVDRHLRVDLVRCVDELCRVPVLAQAPGEEVRHDRDAVASKAGAGVVGHESKRLGGRGVDHLPDRDSEPVAHQCQLVGQRDVDRAKRVLVQLRGLGDHWAAYRNHRLDELAEEELGAPQTLIGHARDQLRRVAEAVGAVTGIDPLGRVAEKDVLSDHLPGALEDGQHDLLGGARVGCRLQHDELIGAQVLGHGLGRGDDVGDVGRAGLRQRCGDADRHRVEVGDRRVVTGGPQAPIEVGVALRGHVDQIRTTLAHRLDPGFVEVDAYYVKAGLRERDRERQPCVSEADDPEGCLAGRNAVLENRGGAQDLGQAADSSAALRPGRRSGRAGAV
jgi:hypothetical protein